MNPVTEFRPRRSCLYMPGNNERALEKAKTLPADVLILDLEDAVAPDVKAEARDAVGAVVAQRAFGSREVIIRINGLDTEWGRADLDMAVAASPDGILVPKVTSGTDIRNIEEALTSAGAAPGLGLWVMIEMPLAILNIQEITAASAGTRLTGVVMGTNDLAKEFNAVPTPDRAAFQVPLALTLAAARAYGLVAIDGVYNDIKDETGLRAECEHGRTLGFDGKSLIHPAQVEAANQVYSPDPDAVDQARAIIAAFALAENRGKGVIKVDGRMVEILHLQQAQRLVAIDDAIQQMN
jgi:citrate lyase subunit beta/citryl-CoA lyase